MNRTTFLIFTVQLVCSALQDTNSTSLWDLLLFHLLLPSEVEVTTSQMSITSYNICFSHLVIRIRVGFFRPAYMQSPCECTQCPISPPKKQMLCFTSGEKHAIFLGAAMLKGLVLTSKAHPPLLRTQLFMKLLLTKAIKAHFYRNSVPAVLYKRC